MEKYENEAPQEAPVETPAETPETLEANETPHEPEQPKPDADQEEPRDATDWRAEYFKLKNEQGDDRQESREGSEKSSEEKLASNDAVLARLEARGVMNADDQEYLLTAAKREGKNPVDLLSDPYFKDRLDAMAKQRKVSQATPSSSNRTQPTKKDDVEYWIKKGDLPTDRELRSKVVKEKTKRAQQKRMFGGGDVEIR